MGAASDFFMTGHWLDFCIGQQSIDLDPAEQQQLGADLTVWQEAKVNDACAILKVNVPKIKEISARFKLNIKTVYPSLGRKSIG